MQGSPAVSSLSDAHSVILKCLRHNSKVELRTIHCLLSFSASHASLKHIRTHVEATVTVKIVFRLSQYPSNDLGARQ